MNPVPPPPTQTPPPATQAQAATGASLAPSAREARVVEPQGAPAPTPAWMEAIRRKPLLSALAGAAVGVGVTAWAMRRRK